MRSGPVPENMMDALALASGLVPTPLIDTLVATGLARTVMVATKLGIFEALAAAPMSAAEVARECDTNRVGTTKLLEALAGAGYLTRKHDRYALTGMARRWLSSSSATSLSDLMELMFVVWRWFEHYELYVKEGRPLDVHAVMSHDDWALYQRGMRSLAGLLAPEVALRTPVPRGARMLLDIGGSHGFYSVALCRRHRRLSATVLDLPQAVDHARAILEREGMGARVTLRAGDARDAELGQDVYDCALVANLVHHFDEEVNMRLMARVARALRPGGVLVVQEVMRADGERTGRQVSALAELYFAALSASGIFGYADIARWQKAAGLTPKRPIRFVSYPGAGQQAAIKR